jgi:hypothetical protein
VLLLRLLFFILQALVRGLRFNASPVHVFTRRTLNGLCGPVLVFLGAIPLVFVVVGRGEWDRRRHTNIVGRGMGGVGTWELEGGGKMLGLRVGSFFERGEEI